MVARYMPNYISTISAAPAGGGGGGSGTNQGHPVGAPMPLAMTATVPQMTVIQHQQHQQHQQQQQQQHQQQQQQIVHHHQQQQIVTNTGTHQQQLLLSGGGGGAGNLSASGGAQQQQQPQPQHQTQGQLSHSPHQQQQTDYHPIVQQQQCLMHPATAAAAVAAAAAAAAAAAGAPGQPGPGQISHYRYIHPRSDGYVAASSAGFQAPPHSGPSPHQGPPTVLRGMQSTAPPTPPQPDLSKMQPPPPQQLFVPATVNNTTGNARANQQNNIYRGAAASSAPRGTQRHVPAAIPQMFPQAIHQSVVLPAYQTFTPRQPSFQQPPSFSYQQALQTGYHSFPYQYYAPNSMISTTAQTHQRGPAGVASGIPVQAGPNGPLGGPNGTQAQIPLTAGAVLATPVLSVPTGQQQVQTDHRGVANQRKKRPHALDIIDPETNKNVLDDLKIQKPGSNSDLDYQDQLGINEDRIEGIYPQDVDESNKALPGVAYMPIDIFESIAVCPMNDIIGQTPVVSANTDGPSVEIPPRNQQQQKRKNKSIPIVAPPDHKDNKLQNVKTAEDILYKAIKAETYDTSTETLSVISNDSSPRDNQSATAPLTAATTNSEVEITKESISSAAGTAAPTTASRVVSVATESPEETSTSIRKNNSNTNSSINITIATSSASTLSSSSASPTLFQQQQTSSSTTAIPKDITAEMQDIAVVNDLSALSTSSAATSTSTQSNVVCSEIPASAIDICKKNLQTSEMNVVHANTQTLLEDLKDNIDVVTTQSSPPKVSAPNDIQQQATDAIERSEEYHKINNNNNNTSKLNKLTDSLDKNLNNINTIVSSSSNTNNSLSTSKKAALVDETDRCAPLSATMGNASSSCSNISSESKPLSVAAHPVSDIVNNNSTSTTLEDTVTVTASDKINPMSQEVNQNTVNQKSVSSSSMSVTAKSSPIDALAASVASADNIPHAESPSGITVNGDVAADAIEDVSTDAAVKLDAVPTPPPVQSLIVYNEGQWSPQNPSGKKQYDRDQLLQLREAKASRISPDVSTINASILPSANNVPSQPNLLPAFVRGNNNNKRVQSMGGIGSMGDRSVMGISGSMGGSGGGSGSGGYMKQSSMSGVNQRNSARGSKGATTYHINLSLHQDVKLNETDNAWRPRVLVNESGESTHNSEELKRRVRGILNKLTPEKFDTLVEQIIKLKIDTNEKVNDVMELVFEKAIDEPNFSVSYARLCQRLVDEVKARDERSSESGASSNLKQFRTSLLDKTENEFVENVSNRDAKERKLQPILDKIRECKDPVEKLELQAQLEEEERKIRRRSGGTVRFIGELFKISMLTGKIISSCIELLLDPKSEDKLECLCKLLTTVGEKFEKTPINPKDPHRLYNLDITMMKMQAIASKTDKDGAKVTSRVRFMLQDVIDLRKSKWISTRGETPKTMDELQKQAKTEQMSTQYMNYSNIMSSSGSGGGNQSSGGSGMKKDDRRYGNSAYGNNRDGSRGGGRGDDGGSMRRQQNQSSNSGGNSNNGDDTWHHVQTSKGNRSIGAVDTNKLEPMLNDIDMCTKKMGGLQQFQWNSSGGHSSQSRTTTTSNSFAVLSSLVDSKNNNDRNERNDRNDRGNRNKGSYNKGSMERDRYDRGLHSRGGSAHGSRESSSSRNNQGRGMMNASNMQKSTSHNKNQFQSLAPRMQGKSGLPASTQMSSLSSQQSQQQSSGHANSTISLSISLGTSAASSVTEYESPVIAPIAAFDEPNDAEQHEIKSAISEMVEIAAIANNLNQVVPCLHRFKENLRVYFLFMILAEYLHLANVGQVQRRCAANIVAYYFKRNFISVDHFKIAYEHFCELAQELILDVPELWMYIFEFTGPLITKKMITLEDLWTPQLSAQKLFGTKFLRTFLAYCTREIGPRFTRAMWKTSKLTWTDFMPEADVAEFITKNKLEFLENDSISPYIPVVDDKKKLVEKVVERVEHMLKEGAQSEAIIDYIDGNIAEVDKLFIRSLTTAVCKFAIIYKDDVYKLDVPTFEKISIPIVAPFVDSTEQRKLECLNAMQLLCNQLEHPRGLLTEMFNEFYEADVMQEETFLKWRDLKEESLAGKGVAVVGLKQFFNHLLSNEGSDEAN